MDELNQQLQALIADARKLLAEGQTAAAKAKRLEADAVAERIEEMKALESTEKRYTPIRPALPGTEGTALVPEVSGGKSGKSKGVAVADEGDDDDDDENLGFKTQKAAYQTRFGDEHSTIKGILTDLHGANYQGAYWAQKAAFNRYLRGGENALRSDDRKLLHGIVLNPAAVKMALNQGVDDLASYRATMVEAADTLGGLSRSSARLTFASV